MPAINCSAGALAENVLHNARIAATESAAAVFAYDVGRLAHLLANDSDRSPDLAGAQWHHHWRCALLGRANRLERRVESSGASSSCCWRGVGSGRRGLHRAGRRPWPTCPGGGEPNPACIHEYTVFSRVFSHGSNTRIIRVNTYSEYVFTRIIRVFEPWLNTRLNTVYS